MADWYRAWHGMPQDPKFRVIAKESGQPISMVLAMFMILLDDASQNSMSRGVTKCHDEIIAVTLDCDMSRIAQIREAMQGRLLDGNRLTGWEIRQPKREDWGNSETGAKSAAERKAAQRERDRKIDVTQCHDVSRNVTTDTDTDTDTDNKRSVPAESDDSSSRRSLKTFRRWMELVRENGEKAIPADDPVFDYAKKFGLPDEFIELAWLEFRAKYKDDDKKYKDWRIVFRRAVRENWLKLWDCRTGGEYVLTSKGLQAQQGKQNT